MTFMETDAYSCCLCEKPGRLQHHVNGMDSWQRAGDGALQRPGEKWTRHNLSDQRPPSSGGGECSRGHALYERDRAGKSRFAQHAPLDTARTEAGLGFRCGDADCDIEPGTRHVRPEMGSKPSNCSKGGEFGLKPDRDREFR